MSVEEFMDSSTLLAAANDLTVDVDAPLTEAEKFVFNWQYKRAMGSFRTALTEAIIRADFTNLARLYKAFPDEVVGHVAYGHNPDWWPRVQDKLALSGMLKR